MMAEANWTDSTANQDSGWQNDSRTHLTLDSQSIAVTVALVLIDAAVIVGNILILLSIAINRKLRTATNCLLFSLASADLSIGIFVIPFSASLQIGGRWIFGGFFCVFWAAIDVLSCTASIMSLCSISVDRYIGVTKPIQHRTIVTRKRILLVIAGIWIVSMAISIGPLLGWRDTNLTLSAAGEQICTVTRNKAYVLFSVISSFYLPAAITIIIYIRIYKAAMTQTRFLEKGIRMVKDCGNDESSVLLRVHSRKNTRRHGHQTPSKGTAANHLSPMSAMLQRHSSNNLSQEVEVGQEKAQISRKSLCNSTNSAQATPSRKMDRYTSLATKLKKFNKQKKAAKTLGIVIGCFLLCWLPFFIILPIDALCADCGVPRIVFDIAFWLGYCNSLFNPIIYGVWNQEFRRTFHALLTCLPCRLRSLNYTKLFGYGVAAARNNNLAGAGTPV